MSWNYQKVSSKEEMLKLIKGFVDIIILGCGYQSSGRLAHWDSPTISNAFLWASFFRSVLSEIRSSDAYADTLHQLHDALTLLTSHPSFPQGLRVLSCDTLANATDFMSTRLFHSLPMRDTHLRAFLMAIIEMDLDKLSESYHDALHAYLGSLALGQEPLYLIPQGSNLKEESVSVIRSRNNNPSVRSCVGDLTRFTLDQVFKRQSVVSCILKTETTLDILSNAIQCGTRNQSDSYLFEEQSKQDSCSPASIRNIEKLVDLVTWNSWKSKNLVYFLDKRTVRLVSAADMIFTAPKVQWIQVFNRLNASSECKDHDLHETAELLLLGCISRKWSNVVECFMSVSYDPVTISNLYHELQNLVFGRLSLTLNSEDSMSPKEIEILEYLASLLDGRLDLLWSLPPILSAAAIPLWSPLFKLYLNEIETQFRGDSSILRCCNCIQESKEHGDCEVAERIWCLHVFHVKMRSQ